LSVKLRIKDNSFRFRITLRELEALQEAGRIESGASYPAPDGETSTFTYAVEIDDAVGEGRLDLDGSALTLRLGPAELQELADPSREGVYLRRQWIDSGGATRRAIAFIEKDRPSSSCDKPEHWIYRDPFDSNP
jgi:hypothetical protein